MADDGCAFGKATRTMQGWLTGILSVIIAIFIIVAGLNAANTSEVLRTMNARIREHDAAIGAINTQNARIETQLSSVNQTLVRIEKILDRGSPMSTAK